MEGERRGEKMRRRKLEKEREKIRGAAAFFLPAKFVPLGFGAQGPKVGVVTTVPQWL